MRVQETMMFAIKLLKYFVKHALNFLTSRKTTVVLGEPFFYLMGTRRKGQKISFTQVKRVLVVRLDEIGDVVLTTPFLRELRRNLPDAWITLIVKPDVYNMVDICPYVNEVLTYNCECRGRLSQLRLHGRAIGLAWKHLWRRHFDLAIVPRWDVDYYHATFLAYFSGATWCLGYSERVIGHKRVLNNGFDYLFTHLLDDSFLKHEVERSLDVISFLGGTIQDDRLELWMSKEDEAFADAALQESHNNELLIAFGIGAREQKKIWPLRNFIELGDWLKKQYNALIVIVGGPAEGSFGCELQQQLGDTIINLAGQTTLRQTVAILKRCNLYIGNDSGPMHMAVAVKIPVIEISCDPFKELLSHPNLPFRFRPWGVPNVVLQPVQAIKPCIDACNSTHAHCILDITVERVKEAVAVQLLRQNVSANVFELRK